MREGAANLDIASLDAADDVDEDMGADNTKRPRRGRGLAAQLGGVHVGGARAPHHVVSLRAACRLRMGAQCAQVAVRPGKGGIQSSVPSHFAAVVTLPPGGKCSISIIVLACCSSG